MPATTLLKSALEQAFCAAGLWPGLGRRTAAELPTAGIVAPDDVTADRLVKIPKVGRQRAERFRWEANAAGLAEVYRRALKAP